MGKEISKKEDENNQEVLSKEEQAILEKLTGGKWEKYGRIAMAALGSLSWVGAILGAAATLSSEKDQGETNQLLFLWVKEHEIKLKELGKTLNSVFTQFESFGDRIKERIESDEYINLVRKTFKIWDQAETSEKKEMLRKLITNAGGTSIVQDDWVRMFLDWIEKYHEFHFRIIAEVNNKSGITRRDMWMNIKGDIPRDDSAEADLFKLLIDDLTRGRVIRQQREVSGDGRFYKKTRQHNKPPSDFMESPFDSDDPYVLTDLGNGFVQYVMNELNPQIGEGK